MYSVLYKVPGLPVLLTQLQLLPGAESLCHLTEMGPEERKAESQKHIKQMIKLSKRK